LVRFTSEGASIRSMVPYGSSNRPNSPHYADQLPLYMKFQTKPMPLDREHWEKKRLGSTILSNNKGGLSVTSV